MSYFAKMRSSSAPSPSPRRAWIEIFTRSQQSNKNEVALPTEGVD